MESKAIKKPRWQAKGLISRDIGNIMTPNISMVNWLNCVWSSDLHPHSKYIACYLRRFMNDFNDMAWPSLPRIEKETGLSRPTVIKYLKLLESEGWIVKDSTKHTSMTYIAVLPRKALEGVKELYSPSKGALPEGVNDVNPNKQCNKQENNNDPVTPSEQHKECWDYEKCKSIWNEVKSDHECPATGCNIVPDSLKSGLLKVHKAYVKYCKDNNKKELERHEWFRAYAKGHLKRCLSFVGKNDSYSWKPSIKDLGQMKTFEALINQ